MNPMPTEPKTEAESHKLREDALEKFFATSLGTGGRHEAFRAGFDACISIMAEAVIRLTEMREVIQRQRRMTPEECQQFGDFVEEELARRTPPPAVGDGGSPETSKQGRAISWWLAHYTNATCPELVAVNFAARLERERNAALSAMRATGGPGK